MGPVLKPSFSGYPEETLIRRFRNSLLQFKKTIQSSKDIAELKSEMDQFISINHQVVWPHHTSGVYRKDDAEKAVDKVLTEYQRYIKALQLHKPHTSYQDLLDAILIVESMIDQLKERL
jgi:hypothetical protein